jgi:hypothetical protein
VCDRSQDGVRSFAPGRPIRVHDPLPSVASSVAAGFLRRLLQTITGQAGIVCLLSSFRPLETTSANDRKSCGIIRRCRVPCFWTSGLGACHHPPGWFHFHISSILSHVFPSITVCIILPRLERIRPRIRILF